MKRIILTEAQLNNIVRKILSEKKLIEHNNPRFETWYRGYNSKYGSQRNHLIWITDDISYARTYGNRVEEITIDTSKLKPASILYDIDNILGYELDYYKGPTKEEADKILSSGFNAYEFEANNDSSYCMCLLSTEPIVRRKELTEKQFNNIQQYDDFNNRNYHEHY